MPVCVDQLLKTQPELGLAVTVCELVTLSKQPFGPGQLGVIDPLPESTCVIKGNFD